MHRHDHKSLRRQGWASISAMLVGAGLTFGQPAGPGDSLRTPGDDAARLVAPETPAEVRAAAASRLIDSSSPEARAAIEQVFANDAGTDAGRQAIVAAIAAAPAAPPWLLPRLAVLLADPAIDTPARARVIAAVASIRTREAVKLLLDEAAAARPAGGRTEVIAALVRLSGHAEFGDDLNRWRLWYEQVQWLPEAEWRRELADSLAARAEAVTAECGRAMERLSGALRQQYLGLESLTDRSSRLVEFLKDPIPEVRRLGILLARQETANARQLEPGVGEAAVELLTDPSPATRREAAELVNILVPTASAERVTAALMRERDPQVAALLLKSAARWPSRELTPVIIAWLEAGPPGAPPACEALDAVQRRGWLTDPAARDAGLRVIRDWLERDRASLPPSGLRLLAVLGTPTDRDRVFSLLRDGEPAIRWTAATAIAQLHDAVPGALGALVDAARSDAALYPITAQAIAAASPTAAGFQLLASLLAPDPIQGRERLLALAAVLPHSELLRASRSVRDASLREAMLTRLLREPLASQRSFGMARTLKPEVIAGLLTLVDTRIELGQPAGALAALDALNAAADRIDRAVLADRRVVVLIWLNRLDDAAKLDVPVDYWLDGLERCIGLEHAPAALAACKAKFPEPWPPAAAERFREISMRLLPPGQP